MYKTYKIKILVTEDQNKLFFKYAGAARWCYNYFIGRNKENYKNGIKYMNDMDMLKELTKIRHEKETWLMEIPNGVQQSAMQDANITYKRFMSGKIKFPHFRSKDRTRPQFGMKNDVEAFYKTDHGCKIQVSKFDDNRLTQLKLAQPLPNLPKDQKNYLAPRIHYDGKNWYLTVVIKVDNEYLYLNDFVLGIDLGITSMATLSDGDTCIKLPNINKDRKIQILTKRLNREQRSLSRKLVANTKRYERVKGRDGNYYERPVYTRPLSECKNIQKQIENIRHIYNKISNIRHDYIHKCTHMITYKMRPHAIVMEDLKVQELLKQAKDRSLRRRIIEMNWYEFRRQMEYKCQYRGIELKFANKYYASSKICSICGNKNKNLKLSDRIYKCPCCGNEIDRDFNAAINLCRLY